MSKSAPTSLMSARLSHLHLLSPDPGSLASFYKQALRMQIDRQDQLWICRGLNRSIIIAQGPAGHVEHIAYAVENRGQLDAIKAGLARHDVPIHEAHTPLFKSGAVAFAMPGGQHLTFGEANSQGETPNDGPSARLQHVVLAVTAIDPIEEFLTSTLGFTVSDRVVDSAGAPRACFLRSDREHHSFAMFRAPAPRLDHHCYETDDWNAIKIWADHFARLRIPLVWGPGRHGPGNNIFMFIEDPDRNRIELSTELEIIDDADRIPGSWPHEERTTNLWGHGFLRD
jgi:catechol 2,3-dioxygenase